MNKQRNTLWVLWEIENGKWKHLLPPNHLLLVSFSLREDSSITGRDGVKLVQQALQEPGHLRGLKVWGISRKGDRIQRLQDSAFPYLTMDSKSLGL